MCHLFQFPCQLGNHKPSLRVDLVYALFLCFQTVVSLPVLGFLFVIYLFLGSTQILHRIAHGGCTNTITLGSRMNPLPHWRIKLASAELGAELAELHPCPSKGTVLGQGFN